MTEPKKPRRRKSIAVPVAAAELVEEYELLVTDHAFEPNYGGWTIQFTAKGAPRLAHQSTDPSLEAFVELAVADSSARRLGSGGGGALAVRGGADTSHEMNYLRASLGAFSVDSDGPERKVPTALPADDVLLAAMKASLDVHLAKVREERARLKVTEAATTIVGRSFKVRA